MEIIKKRIQEYQEDDTAVRITVITFLGIPVFKFEEITTNYRVVQSLKPLKNTIKIKGYYEN